MAVPSEWAAVVFELKNLPRPKSPSFTTAVLVTNTLAGFISNKTVIRWKFVEGGLPLCMTRLVCMCSRAEQTWTKYRLKEGERGREKGRGREGGREGERGRGRGRERRERVGEGETNITFRHFLPYCLLGNQLLPFLEMFYHS